MTEKLIGSWTLDRTENLEEFMKEYGLNYILRKIALSIGLTLEIKNEGNKWSVKAISTFKNDYDEFTIGVEFNKDTLDGRKSKVICKIEDDKLIAEQRDRATSQLQATLIKHVDDNDEMIEELISNNVKGLRIYKRNK